MNITNDIIKQDSQIKSKALEKYISWLEDILEQPISKDENFLDIGGHSMIAISLNERVKNEFGLSLSIERLYNKTLDEVFSSANYLSEEGC
ncbi:phosphopantetheine-binding protein [Pectobacteriaceae bacterium C52]|nr:phosphopantetheine-binding protein [Pectobacteriaceae bacterium C52]